MDDKDVRSEIQLNGELSISGLSEEQKKEVDELVRRIYEKEEPKRAKELVSLIKNKGYQYAKYLMKFYDQLHMKYDAVLFNESSRGVLFVKKNGMYGVVDMDGNVIIPCKFKNYSDAYLEWSEFGFPSKPMVMTGEEKVKQKVKDALNAKHDELVATGDIKPITFFNERSINGAEFVTMSDGLIGIAAAVIAYDSERGKNLEIKYPNGEHAMFLSEPELYQGTGTPQVVICSDGKCLYVASYGNEYSYIACYRMGDFERVWKTTMYGSRIQSIAVNDDEVIVFDMKDGKIKYFDKQNGSRNKEKEIETDKDSGFVRSHHELAATNERLLAGVPGLTFGLLELANELKMFSNDTGELLAQKSVSQLVGILESLTIDKNNNRVYIAFGNVIAVFGEFGYEGFFLAPTKSVHKLNFDQETGCLMVSMTEGKGKVEVYSQSAIKSLLQTSKILISSLGSSGLETIDSLQISGDVQKQDDNKHKK